MIITNKNILKLILCTSFVLKIIVAFFFHGKGLTNEWATLLYNLENFKIFSYYNIEGQNIPSSYMPPLYLIFLYINKVLSFDLFNFIYLTYFFQVILSTFSVLFFFRFCNYFFNEKLSNVGAAIFALLPLLILSNAMISSASLQVFFYLLFFNYLIEIIIDKKKINNFLFITIITCCLFLRGEFLIVLFLSLLFIAAYNRKKIKFVLIVLISTFIIISPYLIRNYINTNSVHIVNVTGYALWKGNNHFGKVEGFHDPLHPRNKENRPKIDQFYNLYDKLDGLEASKGYEKERDQIFLNEAINNILEDKKKYFLLYLKKIISYFFIDQNSSIKNYYNFFHIIPNLTVAVLAVCGIFISFTKKKDTKLLYILMIMSSLILLVSIFYILPRYKISIINFQILFSLFSLDYIYKKLINKK
jgi:hypothetical protein